MNHGFHWSRCGGGGADFASLLVPLIGLGAAAGVAMIVLALMWWIVAAVAVLAAAAVWWLLTQPGRKARWDEAYRAAFAAREAAAAEIALQRQAFALELARASAPQIQNVIDPTPLVAAALAALGVQPQPQPVTIRAEVQR